MIGKSIQEKRKALGLTQSQLAELLGVTAPAVNRWEKDLSYPDANLLAPLARALKTDLNALFSFYDSLSDKERGLSDDPLFKEVSLGGILKESASTADLMADIMVALKKKQEK